MKKSVIFLVFVLPSGNGSESITWKDFSGPCNTFKGFIQQSANVFPKRFNAALHL